ESRHNRKYWRREPYVGLGPGAHSFDGERRWENATSAADYRMKIERGDSPIEKLRRLTDMEELEEFFFLGLRESAGVEFQAVARWRRRKSATTSIAKTRPLTGWKPGLRKSSSARRDCSSPPAPWATRRPSKSIRSRAGK